MGLNISKLKKATMDNTPEWSLNNKIYKVKVLKVYDGDTIWVAISLLGEINRLKVRLSGIDTPEMKPLKSKPNRELEIKAAKKSRDFLADLILNKIIEIKCGKWDKYGRLLATLFIYQKTLWDLTKININQLMIDNDLAIHYDGGCKTNFLEV